MKLAAAAVIVVLGLTACGGNESEPAEAPAEAAESTTTTQDADATGYEAEPAEEAGATEDEFIRAADRICRRANERIQELSAKRALRVVGRGIQQLRTLEVPASLELGWRQYMTALELQYEADLRGDSRESRRQRQRKSEIAIDLGFAVCGSG